MYDMILFEELYKIFPDAFSVTRTYHKTVAVNTPFWVEYQEVEGESTAILAEYILRDAQGIADRYGIDHAITKYLPLFKGKKAQKQEIEAFLKG